MIIAQAKVSDDGNVQPMQMRETLSSFYFPLPFFAAWEMVLKKRRHNNILQQTFWEREWERGEVTRLFVSGGFCLHTL